MSDKTNRNKKSSSPLTKTDDITNTIRFPNPFDNNPEGFDLGDPDSGLNKNADEQKIFIIFEKISPLID